MEHYIKRHKVEALRIPNLTCVTYKEIKAFNEAVLKMDLKKHFNIRIVPLDDNEKHYIAHVNFDMAINLPARHFNHFDHMHLFVNLKAGDYVVKHCGKVTTYSEEEFKQFFDTN